MLVVVYVLRLMALVLLTAAAPLALAAYALPQTAWAARWWWRALTACLAIQVAQALVLTAAVRVFSSAGWIPLNGTSSSLLPVLTALCLLYIMMRIPWWISRPVLASFGPSPIRRAARFAFYAAVLSRVSPLLRGAAAGKRPPSSAGGQGRKPAGPRGGGPARRRTWRRRTTRGGPGPAAGQRAGRGRTWRRPRRDRGPDPAACPQRACRAGAPAIRSRPPAAAGAARPAGAGAGRGGTMPRQAQGGAVPAGSGPAPGRAGQARPPLPGMPPRPRTPRPGQRVLPFEVTRMPRSGAPGPRPARRRRSGQPARAPPSRRCRVCPAVPARPASSSCPLDRRPPASPAAGSRPQPRQAPAAPVPRVPEGDHR